LESHIFKGLPWSPQEKLAFLGNWEAKLLGYESPSSKKYGRWKQGAGIDCFTAADFIEYFLLKFLNNPSDYQSGEIACILWILIRCAQNGCSNNVSVEHVRNLTTQQIADASHILQFKNCKSKISKGLHQLLICLRGKGAGEHSYCLFGNVTKKALERALHIASKEILPEGAMPVLPGAFLVSPHLHPGTRICPAERLATKSTRQLVPHRYMSKEVLNHLKNENATNRKKNP